MAEIQPPMYVAGGCYTAQQDRMLWDSIICEEGTYANPGLGGLGPNSLAVTAGLGMEVIVESGRAFVQGDSVQFQGVYYVWNSSPVTLTLDPSDPTDDRIDLVVAKINDTEYEGTGTSDWQLQVVTGSPSPAPVAPALPPSALPLAEVRVNAGATTTGTITDLREPYRMCPGCGGR